MRHKEEKVEKVTVNRWRKAVFFLCAKMCGKERDMNFGQGIYTWLMTNVQWLLLAGIVVIGVVLLLKHKIAELIVFAIISIIAVGFVFNPTGTKDAMLNIYNGTVIQGGAAGDDGGE